MSDTPLEHYLVLHGESVASRHVMGLRRLGTALKKARGTMSQKAAAHTWGVPLSTLSAIEQGIVRDYQSQTLAQFDAALGESAYEIYASPDQPTIDDLAALTHRVEALEAAHHVVVPSALESLIAQLAGDEVDELVSFANFIISRRHQN